jgi:TDG/mug DNA glycosylase family protein
LPSARRLAIVRDVADPASLARGPADDRLPDVLAPDLAVVFCGTAAGRRSAQTGCYYAGPGNKFWPTLAKIGLTPRQLRPDEFRQLLRYGIGLTDIAKRASGADAVLRSADFDVPGLRTRLAQSAPRIVAFNGKKAAAAALGVGTRDLAVGPLGVGIGSAELFVLPSTSGAASGYWSLAPWQALAERLRRK